MKQKIIKNNNILKIIQKNYKKSKCKKKKILRGFYTIINIIIKLNLDINKIHC